MKYTEKKKENVLDAMNRGGEVAKVARRFKIAPATVRKWRDAAMPAVLTDAGQAKVAQAMLVGAEQTELTNLRHTVLRLKTDNEALRGTVVKMSVRLFLI